jgi:Flp pilus assembly protein TadD
VVQAAAAASIAPKPSATVADPTPDPVAARRFTSDARTFLGSGRLREGVAAARSAIEADPSRAEPYVLLAAGLEDLGNWAGARATFAACAARTHAAECRYFAGSIR